MVEQHTDSLSVNLIDMDQRTALEELKKYHVEDLTNVQVENRLLKEELQNVKTDLASHQKLFSTSLGDKNLSPVPANSDEVLRAIKDIKDALNDRPANSMKEFEKNVTVLGEKVMSSNAALAKSEEVFKNSNKFPPLYIAKASPTSQSQSSSVQQQPTKADRQTFKSKFSKIFTSSKADSESSNTARQGADRRNSSITSVVAATDQWENPRVPTPAKTHYSNKDFE